MRRTRVLNVLSFILVLTGCAGLIGVPDLTFDEQADQGRPDGSTGVDGPSGDGSLSDAGDAAPPCDETKLQTDPLNCGRCGHDCIGGACKDGKCEAVALGSIGGAPLRNILEHGNELFVTTIINFTYEKGGIWKLGKAPGNPVLYADVRYARDMVVLGDTLYFVAYDDIFDDAGAQGGFYACDLNGPTPCVPKLIAPADSPLAIATDQGKVYYNDGTSGKGILQFTPPGPPVVFRKDWNPVRMWIDKEAVYYVSSPGVGDNASGVLWELYPDAGDISELSRYQKRNAVAGDIAGGPNAVYFSAYDYQTTTGGVVRRVSRPGTPGVQPCEYGGLSNKRPFGIYVDGSRIYWANQGDPDSPWDNGSIASCELDTCCTDPTVHWTGNGEPIGLTGDDKGIYWVTYRTSTIWKMAKP